jgi:hephaestin
MLLTLLLVAAAHLSEPQPLATQPAQQTRVYYIAADEIMWDFAPSGMDEIRGIPIDSAKASLQRPGSLGRVYKKAVYREYTDASFSELKPRPPEWEHLGLLGPLVRAVVGDTIMIVFRNNASHPYSVHPHGVLYDKSSEGTPYRDGTYEQEKHDDAVPPGETHTYVWEVPDRAGPGPGDGSSIMWMYHSHVDEGKDVTAGLMGPMIITAPDMAREDGSPIDIDREFVINFAVYFEPFSHYFKDNIALQMPWANVDSLAENRAFQQTGKFFDSMNGYIWGNMPGLTFEQGEKVRWYVMSSTSEFDFHTPHWHGMTVLVHNTRMDIISVEPMMMVHADMVADNPGIWFFHCHVKVHLEGGMAARFAVLPKNDPVARARIEEWMQPMESSSDGFLASGARLPGTWQARPDRGDVRRELLRLMPMGDGLHVTLGPSAVFYDAARVATGSYQAKATFTQTKPTEHPEGLGILLGGKDLEGEAQSYLYFLVRQDGKYMIKHRAGSETHTLVDWTSHGAVRRIEGDGGATNELVVEVGENGARFIINGAEVVTLPRSENLQTDGIMGLRINHNLDVHVSGVAIEGMRSAGR